MTFSQISDLMDFSEMLQFTTSVERYVNWVQTIYNKSVLQVNDAKLETFIVI